VFWDLATRKNVLLSVRGPCAADLSDLSYNAGWSMELGRYFSGVSPGLKNCLGSWVRIPLEEWIYSVSGVLSVGKSLATG
jgi:hypothetical protein